jgi:hypothetical protein
MRYWKLFGVAVVAVCALGVSMSVSAFGALPLVLPETVKTFTGKSVGTGLLQEKGGTKVECKTAKAMEGTVEQPKPLGLFHIHFEGCTTTVLGQSGECTGLGDEKGTILSLGSYHLVYDSLTPLGVAILFLLDNVHFTCTVLGVTALVLVPLGGMVLCLILSPEVLAAVYEFHCNQTASGSGVAQESKYYNEGGTLVSISTLLSAENEKTAGESAEVALGTIEYPVDVLLMI